MVAEPGDEFVAAGVWDAQKATGFEATLTGLANEEDLLIRVSKDASLVSLANWPSGVRRGVDPLTCSGAPAQTRHRSGGGVATFRCWGDRPHLLSVTGW
jgi:hypothetical protein